jgi:hypothetical protein
MHVFVFVYVDNGRLKGKSLTLTKKCETITKIEEGLDKQGIQISWSNIVLKINTHL